MSSTRPGSRRDLRKLGMVDFKIYEDESDGEPVQAPRQTRKHARETPDRDFKTEASGSDYDGRSPKRQHTEVRQSARSNKHIGSMIELTEDDIGEMLEDTASPARQAKTIEIFEQFSDDNAFAMCHIAVCEACNKGNDTGPLVHCQGCSMSYHQSCISKYKGSNHTTVRISVEHWALYCKACVGKAHQKNNIAPDLGKCTSCGEHGSSCKPTEPWTEDEGESHLRGPAVNDADSVLRRCWQCSRAWHTDHMPDTEFTEDRRWRCYDCVNTELDSLKLGRILAWRPVNEEDHDDDFDFALIPEDEKMYLIKWDKRPYASSTWMYGSWVWAIASPTTKKAFASSKNAQKPLYSLEEAVPESYSVTDIVLLVQYKDGQHVGFVEDIDWAYVKFKGLGYEDAAWISLPSEEDVKQHDAFYSAYEKFRKAKSLEQPRPVDVKDRLRAMRRQDYNAIVRKTQPELLTGGELMKHQVEGMQWLNFKWYSQTNAILGDEMGLGKTIQVIAFLATLVQDWQCWPHLVVVPNSTCENWRREFARWAPGLHVVAYYGSQVARQHVYDYELYPDQGSALRCHIVITSYDMVSKSEPEEAAVLYKTRWQSLVADEAQRLKNDNSNLYGSLSKIKVPFKILLTGTPLQNNQRELFNLLHFIDQGIDAAELERNYEELNENKIQELHAKLRPHFMRRTKAEELSQLSPMAHVILPLSMPYDQKELYRDILSSSPKLINILIKSGNATAKQVEGVNLNNILMELRKCLGHPLLCKDGDYSTHDKLVQHSGKLILLKTLLPRLQQAGHRVLIFSQFLGMLDTVADFFDGTDMRFTRLDGSMNAIEKQKRVDDFNAPDSQLFAFLLSTRAGGVGINLATADTVIILDPDFNPHQDVQAVSRAHRIGQTKPVLCLQLITKDTVEERIMQVGRKKLALDRALIQDIDEEAPAKEDLLSILRHGATALLGAPEEVIADVVYDEAALDKLLDRSKIEHAPAKQDVKNMWAFAQVWTKEGTANQNVIEEAQTEVQTAKASTTATGRKSKKQKTEDESAYGRGHRSNRKVNYLDTSLPEELEEELGLPMGKAVEEAASDEEFHQSDADDSDERGKSKIAKQSAGKSAKGPTRGVGRANLKPNGKGGYTFQPPVNSTWGVKTSKPRAARKPAKKKVTPEVVPEAIPTPAPAAEAQSS